MNRSMVEGEAFVAAVEIRFDKPIARWPVVCTAP